jgi:hypothetical protein
LDGAVVPTWIATVLRDIRNADMLHLALVVINSPGANCIGGRGKSGLWSSGLFRLYEALDHRLFRVKKDALKPVDVMEDLSGAGGQCRQPFVVQARHHLAGAERGRIHAANLDVVLDFSCGAASEEWIDCSRWGVWSVHIGDQKNGRRIPMLFPEIYARRPVVQTEVRVRTKYIPSDRVIYRAFSRLNFLSLYLSRNGICWKMAAALMRCLRNLQSCGWEGLPSLDPGEETDTCPNGFPGPPGVLTMARFLIRSTADVSLRLTRRSLYRNQWILALRPRAGDGSSVRDSRAFRLIIPSRKCFYADPFILKKGGINYVFCEEYPFDRPKGLISCFQVDASGNYSEPRVVLEREYHLSYPFVFEWQGQTYLLPETGANRTIEIYRAVEFPYRWELAHVLMENVHARDATLLEYGGKFWLFVNSQTEGQPEYEELDVFFANSPFGPWTAHPKNPVVSDVRRARPAGQFIRMNGQLLRPAQDCSVRYGYAVWFNRVDVLSETDYREVPVQRIDPDWLPGNLATHTYNQNEDFEVLDAQLLIRKRELTWRFPSMRDRFHNGSDRALARCTQ